MRCGGLSLSTPTSALSVLRRFSIDRSLLNRTVTQSTFIQEAGRKLGLRTTQWEFSLNNIRLESRYAWMMHVIGICSISREDLI